MNDHEIVYCSECGCTLDSDFREVGVCNLCLDKMDDDKFDVVCDKVYYDQDWDYKIEDEY